MTLVPRALLDRRVADRRVAVDRACDSLVADRRRSARRAALDAQVVSLRQAAWFARFSAARRSLLES